MLRGSDGSFGFVALATFRRFKGYYSPYMGGGGVPQIGDPNIVP